MKKWTDPFVSRALDGLPKDKYRARAQAELTDHLLELADELESGGYSPEEAQQRALELMGKPEELKPSFQAEWMHRASRLGYCLHRMLMWAFYGLLFNTFIRAMISIPSVALMRGQTTLSPVVMLLSVVWFMPGLWFAVHNVRRDFALFSRRRQILLLNVEVLLVWLLDMSPIILTVLIPPIDDISLAFVFFSYLPLIVAEGDFFTSYLVTMCVLCVVFPLFYRPRRVSGGESL